MIINRKKISIPRYPNIYGDSGNITLESNGRNEKINFDGTYFIFDGQLPGFKYEFKVDSLEVFGGREFSWIEAKKGNRIKMYLDNKNLNMLEQVVRGI